MTDRRRVVVVTGGGGGIGAAIAGALGRTGATVVTVDPLVTVDGTEQEPAGEATTADRIVAAGGRARASSASVTDGPAMASLFEELAAEFDGIDAVVNVAGISRPTGFARGSDDDWRAVLAVHLDGYLNVLRAALPHLAAAGRGHVLGVTSGSGWRAADAGAYSCAKRAVASITWELGRLAPPGVVVNALSPIAATRMVTAALARAPKAASTGGLALGSMPEPAELGPVAAHLVDPRFEACHGQVIFSAGSEVAVVREPELLEVVRTDGPGSLAGLLDAVLPGGFSQAAGAQRTAGATNARFADAFAVPAGTPPVPVPTGTTVAVVGADRDVAGAVIAALERRGVTCAPIDPGTAPAGALDGLPEVDAVVVAPAPQPAASAPEPWAGLLAEHDGVVAGIADDARWTRAVAARAASAQRPIRLVFLTDGTTAGGRSRAQALAQLSRAGLGATDERVPTHAITLEAAAAGDRAAAGELVASLVATAADGVAGSELVVGSGWIGLRGHPRPGGSIAHGPDLPPWFDDVLRRIVGGDARR